MTAAPELLFIHGAGSSASFWHLQRAAFPDAHYLNLPGHTDFGSWILGFGLSDSRSNPKPKIQDPKSIEGYADWVAEYIEGERLRDVVLDGHSMGGAIALTLALRRPEWLRAVVLTGTGARLRVLPDLLEKLRTDYPAAVDLIIELSFAPPSESPSYAEKIRRNGVRRQLLRTPREVTLADYEACDSFDVMERIREIKVPTLCIVGAHDRMTPPKYSQYLHREIRGSRLAVIEGAGHMLPMERPEEYNRLVGEFLVGLK